MSYYCGVDIGGTFTDCVLVDETGTITLAKASSTPQDFSQGFLDAIEEAARQRGIDPEGIFGEIELLLHGTTVGTNVLVQMRGAKTGLITTRGHRDALVMMRSYGRSAGLPIEKLLHVSRHRKPDPIVPPQLIKEVSERVDWAGDVFLPLNEDEARAAVEELVAEGVDAIAISFLWGFVNPDHERRVKALVQELAPDVFVSCAHELIAKPGEYERTAAAAINCYVGPSTSTYVQRLDGATRERGYTHPLLIMQAAGGVVPANEVAEAPLFTIGSGPVGGVTGATFLADVLGHKNVIACDMGGTSFDVGLVHDGLPISSSETVINQYTFFMPRLLIESIGAGGGSIVWVDEQSGTIRVGPESAGADPGPACYGRGGERPTITDANVLLGRYNPENFLGGRLALDREAAERAMASVAEALGMDVVEAAAGAAADRRVPDGRPHAADDGRAGARPARVRRLRLRRRGRRARRRVRAGARLHGGRRAARRPRLHVVGARRHVLRRAPRLRARGARRRRRSTPAGSARSTRSSRSARAPSSPTRGSPTPTSPSRATRT